MAGARGALLPASPDSPPPHGEKRDGKCQGSLDPAAAAPWPQFPSLTPCTEAGGRPGIFRVYFWPGPRLAVVEFSRGLWEGRKVVPTGDLGFAGGRWSAAGQVGGAVPEISA